MKILFSSHPAIGHLWPMLPLARAAARAGHDVIVATGPDLAPKIAARGFRMWTVGPTFAEAWAERNTALPDLDSVPPERHMELDISVLFGATSAKRAVELVPMVEEWAPELVIHEPSEFAAPLAARRAGARHVTHGLGLAPPAPLRAMLEPAMAEVYESWDEPGLAADVFDRPYLDICPPSLVPAGEPAFSDRHSLRPLTGDVLPTDRLPAAVHRLPHADTVYLTLGTVFHDAPGVFEACLAGLRELPVNVVVTVGPAADPTRLGSPPPNVVIEPYLPQALVLPLCRLVISHGGAGTMLGALAEGLPQLVLPQAADQFLNATATEAAGAGLVLPPGTITAEAVGTAVRRLLDEPGFSLAAKDIQSEITAMPPASAVLDDLT